MTLEHIECEILVGGIEPAVTQVESSLFTQADVDTEPVYGTLQVTR